MFKDPIITRFGQKVLPPLSLICHWSLVTMFMPITGSCHLNGCQWSSEGGLLYYGSCLIGWSIDWSVINKIDWLVGWSTDWLIDWLIDWFYHKYIEDSLNYKYKKETLKIVQYIIKINQNWLQKTGKLSVLCKLVVSQLCKFTFSITSRSQTYEGQLYTICKSLFTQAIVDSSLV